MTQLPVVSASAGLKHDYSAYLTALAANFRGDIDHSYGGRLLAGTDNSVYQTLPQAVLYPRDEADLQQALTLAQQPEFSKIQFSPRGGGTGTNGQSLTDGIVVDLSRYFTKIIEINSQEGWVRVQTGVVKDRLNDALAPHGWFFSPDLSTSNRATIGGMINTDASGQGSLVYGKTSDHVLALNSVLVNGEVLATEPVSLADAEARATTDSTSGRIYRQVLDTCVAQRADIEAKFPPLNRFLTGYDLHHAYQPEPADGTGKIDVSRLLAGSEGSLAFITEAKLNLTRIPRHKVLVNVKYSDFQAALRHASTLVKARATSVETIDSNVLNLARNDIIWDAVKDHIQDVPGQLMNGINMVEYTAVEQAEIDTKLAELEALLSKDMARPESGVIGYQVCRELHSIQTIYAMRKKAVGLLGATKGSRKPVAFAEDTAVPPEKLADFIAEFRALLDAHQLHYGMFGHVDAGVLHVRPALDLTQPEDEKLLRTISDEVAKLTAKYGGLMWGEHGKGYRSEYAPSFFGDKLFTELRKIKTCFDPNNRLNPGKICTPLSTTEPLVSVDATKRGYFDRQIPVATRADWQPAMDCNGNGLCFNYDQNSPMCPSFKVTGDRRYSPKGRAGLIREWLRLQTQAGYDPSQTPVSKGLRRAATSQTDDFSHEVKASMDKCLACKACASQCPVKVDVPSFRAKFLAHYHSRYRRPLKDLLVKTVEQTAPLMAKVPRLSNALTHNPLSRWVLRTVVGYVDAPKLSVPSLAARWQAHGWPRYAVDVLVDKASELASNAVLIIQDPFTSYYEAELVERCAQVIAACGYQPVLVEFLGNGKAQHVKGYLPEFTMTATQVSEQLSKLQAANYTMVGLDASTTLVFRDEYQQFVAADKLKFQVQTFDEWLVQAPLQSLKDKLQPTTDNNTTDTWVLLSHCTEKTAVPASVARWQQVFKALQLPIQPIAVGCCGMAGTFGHEQQNLEDSKALYAMTWQDVVNDHGADKVLATGFSCRSQAQRLQAANLRHPAMLIAARLQP